MKSNIHIVTICGCGMGSSLMLRINIEKLLKEVNIDGTVEVADMIAGKGASGDIAVTTTDILRSMGDISKNFQYIVLLTNLVSKKELNEKLVPLLMRLNSANHDK